MEQSPIGMLLDLVCVRRVLLVSLPCILRMTNPSWLLGDTGTRLLFCCVWGRHLVLLGGTPYTPTVWVVAPLRVRRRSRLRLLRRSGRPILGLRWYASPELSEVFVYHPLRARQNHMSIVLTALCSCCLRSSSAGAFHCISSSEKGVQAHRAIHEGRTAS